MILVVEALGLITVAGALLGPVFVALLAAVTRIGEMRSRDFARRAERNGDPGELPVTRFARPAKRAALIIVGIQCLALAGALSVWILRPQGMWYATTAYVTIGLSILVVVLLAVTWILLVAVAGDVVFRRRIPGRDTWVAYGLVAGLNAVVTAGYLAMAAASA